MKTRRSSKSGSRSGVALVLAITVLSVLMTASYIFFNVALSSTKRSRAGFDDRRAFLLADAGLHESFEALRGGGSGGIASMADPALLGGGVFWVVATDLGGTQTDLRVTAMVGGGRHSIQTVVDFTGGKAPLFETTLNSEDQLTLNSSVVIDSYDSSLGSYASQAINVTNGYPHAAMNGTARSNGNIVLNANTQVFGDATPGPSSSVSFGAGAYVSGSTAPAPQPFGFPAIATPSYPAGGALSVPPGGVKELLSGKYELPYIDISKAAILVIRGPAEIVVNDFSGGKNGGLVIDATLGPVTITVRNTYTHTAGFTANAWPGSPMALAFMLQGTQDVLFPASTAIRGAYYAPKANIVFNNGNECWGAFAGKRVTMSNNMRFHFDENLANYWKVNSGGQNANFKILGWADAAVQPTFLLADRRDPISALGLQLANLRTPAGAWHPALPPGP